ncbi:AfsR/SARP family transcriptional regulator [Micromonospora sp. NPDC005113]
MSSLVVLLLLVGPPVVLVSLVGSPVRGWPSGEQVLAWVQQPLTEQTLAFALTVGAWLVWLVLAYTVTVRFLTRLRAGAAWLRRVPLPTPLQATASGMAGAAVFSVTANPSSPPEPPVPVAAGSLETLGDPATADRSASVQVDGGILVSGGWLPREVADQVALAGALVWLRRRRAYRPGLAGRDDADLSPLPATAAAVQAALADHSSPSRPTAVPAEAPVPVATASISGLPAAGVGLTGPGALAAARGLLVTVLLTGQGRPAVPLVVTRAALSTLVGTAAAAIRHRPPHLQVMPTLHDAVKLLESSPARHAGREREKPQRRENGAAVTGGPAAVLIVDGPSGALAQRLAGLCTAGAGIVVVLGQWPAGASWYVDAAGHTSDPRRPGWAGARLCVLDTVAATDLLTVMGHIDPAPPVAPDPQPSHRPLPLSPRIPRQASRDTRAGSGGRRIQVRVFGEPMLSVDGATLTIRRTAALQALVFLAAHPAGAHSGQLVEALWPGLPRHSLTGRLYTALSELRGAIRAASGLDVIDNADDRYRLNPTHVDTDLWRFHTTVQHAATAVTDRTLAWQAVIDAYPAEVAAGRAWPWLDPIREAVRRHVIDAHAALAAAAPTPRQALHLLQDGIRVDPYNAELHTRAMNALAALGEHQTAVELHDTYTRRLAVAGLDADEADGTAVRLRGATT